MEQECASQVLSHHSELAWSAFGESRSNHINLIAITTTEAGLKIRGELDRGKYPTGINITDAELALLKLKLDNFQGDWDYTVMPKRTNS